MRHPCFPGGARPTCREPERDEPDVRPRRRPARPEGPAGLRDGALADDLQQEGPWSLPLRIAARAAATLVLAAFVSTASARPIRQAAAQSREHATLRELMQTLQGPDAGGEEARIRLDPRGFLHALGTPPGKSLRVPGVPSDPEVTARAFLKSSARLLGPPDLKADFAPVRTSSRPRGRTSVRLQQTYGGIPVFGAEVRVQLDAALGVEFVLSDVARDMDGLGRALDLVGSVRPAASVVASTTAALVPAERTLETSEPQLLFFAPEVLAAPGDPVLVWRFETRGGGPDSDRSFLVDAVSGEVVRDYPLWLTALDRQVHDSANSTADPGTLVRSEGQAPSGNVDVDSAYDFLGDTYDFYSVNHGRDSIDGAGLTLSATVRYCSPSEPCPYANAYWNGMRMYFGQGYATDDVTGHELTHGVTQYESGLKYENHSGAINESFSDVWGEFVDLSNGATVSVLRWVIGEELPIGPIRSLKFPPLYGDPDRLGSPLFVAPVAEPNSSNDYGGVHTNSGVNNKLAYLLTDGDTFNGKTVSAMGIPLVADLYYEVQTGLLTSASDYFDLYDALQQAALNLGLSVQQRANVQRACEAVEIGTAGRYVFVDLANAGSEDGSPQFPYNTVTEGVAALQPGDYLCIQSGAYPEQPTIGVQTQVLALGGPVLIGP